MMLKIKELNDNIDKQIAILANIARRNAKSPEEQDEISFIEGRILNDIKECYRYIINERDCELSRKVYLEYRQRMEEQRCDEELGNLGKEYELDEK